MADITDRAIEALLRDTLASEAGSVPLRIRPQDVQRRVREHREERLRRRLSLLPAVALLLVPIALVWVVGTSPAPEEQPGYRAVLVRGLDQEEDGRSMGDLEVVAAGADGSARLVRRLPADRIANGRWPSSPALSTQGWLAFSVESGDGSEAADVLLDLGDPDRAPRVLPGWSRTGWAPDGTLWRASDGQLERIDPASSTSTPVALDAGEGLDAWPLGSWSLATTMDGELVVMAIPDRVDPEATLPRIEEWGGMDATGRLTRAIPRIAENGRARLLSPRWGVLWVCDTDPNALAYCPGRPRGSIISGPAGDGSYRTWRGRPAADDYVLQASWAADGGVWLLVDRRSSGRSLVLTHLAPDGTEREAASLVVDPHSSPTIDGLAPDDSTIAIGWVDAAAWWTAVVDTRSGRAALHRGALAGFAGDDEARAWVHGDGIPKQGVRLAASTPPGAIPGYPALPTLEEQTQGMERVLLVHEEPARQVTSETSRSPVLLGPIDLDVGYGVSLVCSGPGDVSYRVDDDPAPVLLHCQDGFPSEQSAPMVEEDVSVSVTADASVAWRVVVYDPPPWTPRRPPTSDVGS